MKPLREILQVEIWSKRTSRIIVFSVIAILGMLYCFAFVMEHWLSPIGKRKAEVLFDQAEAIRMTPPEKFRLTRSEPLKDRGSEGLTVRDDTVIAYADSLSSMAQLCRDWELHPRKALHPEDVRLNEQLGSGMCKSYEFGVKMLHSALASKTGF